MSRQKTGPGRSLMAIERRRKIHDLALRDGSVSVSDLAALLGVAQNTVRADLDALQREGKVRRSHGGAVLNGSGGPTPPYAQMRATHLEEKSWIGAAAARLLPSSGCVFINAGSTTLQLAAAITGEQQISVTTNSPELALLVSRFPLVTVDLLGGRMIRESQETDGSLSGDAIDSLFWDVVFYGMTALDEQHGITSASHAPAMLDRRILAHTRKVVGLCDSSKLGLYANARVGPVEILDVLVTDANARPQHLRMLREHGVEVVLASREGVHPEPETAGGDRP